MLKTRQKSVGAIHSSQRESGYLSASTHVMRPVKMSKVVAWNDLGYRKSPLGPEPTWKLLSQALLV